MYSGVVRIPRYLNGSELSRRIGVEHNAITNWRRRYPPDGDVLPTPAVDAWEITASGDKPLWVEGREKDWQDWQAAHKALLKEWRTRRMATGSTP